MDTGMKKPNRLIDEASPYLHQHAYNPIAWQPWGEEAFAEAARHDLPIFLSIGYASCHWCHVMAAESFEDALIAELLNEHYVPIKVDREQWPDVDAFYMQACVALQGQGGWPLNVFLLPDRRPFYAASYLPAGTRKGQPGLCGLLSRITGMWDGDRGKLMEWADQLTNALACTGSAARADQEAPSVPSLSSRLESELLRTEDREHGGIGGSPKFPNAPALRFLLCRTQRRATVDASCRMAMRALRAMAQGGIRDHVGHGFFRYTVDSAWRTPHFEKMLQDNALLALAYLEAAQLEAAQAGASPSNASESGGARQDSSLAEVARDALDYIVGTLTGELGGFYSSQDADDPLGEGAYYQWTPEEVRQVLGLQDGVRGCMLLGIGLDGGALDRRPVKSAPRCDPKTGCTLTGFEQSHGWLPFLPALPTEPDAAFLQACLPQLARVRALRPAPRVIELCPLLGNGIAIAALATAAQALDAPEYLRAAEGAARFIGEHMAKKGRLMGSWSGGSASCPATVEGYAAFIWGLICLHSAAPKDGWLAQAEHWQAAQRALFLRADGGLTLTGSDLHDLPADQCAVIDDAMPSGAAMTAANLLALHCATGQAGYKDDYERLLCASLTDGEGQLFACAALLAAAQG